MAGYVTLSRKGFMPEVSFLWHVNSKPREADNTYWVGDTPNHWDRPYFSQAVWAQPVQTTHSWRTGSVGEGDDDEFVIPKNQIEAQRMYRDRYARDKRASSHDTGHVFDTTHTYYEMPANNQRSHVGPVTYRRDGVSRTAEYWGALAPDIRYAPVALRGFASVPTFSSGEYGTRAISATRPTHPSVDLAVGVAELKREGLPHLAGIPSMRSRTERVRSGQDSLLNFEFGWKPLLSDVRALGATIRDSKKLVDQYIRDQGRVIRRSYSFEPEVNTTTTTVQGGRVYNPTSTSEWESSLFGYSGVASGILTVVETTTKLVWFKGAYTYHVPVDRNLLGKLERYEQLSNRLFGTRVTPEVVWNLAPWSWFSDWNWNLGAVLSNASALTSDGLVLRYGYLMCDTAIKRDYILEGIRPNQGPTLPPIQISLVTRRKQRVRANPYGFGTTDGYTTRQWSILAALGLTKSPSSLKRD